MPDFARNLTQRPHSLCFIDQHKEWGDRRWGQGSLCVSASKGVLQGCHEGALTVSPARCEGARWVSARCCQRCQGRNSVSACRHGAVSVTIACHNGARYVLVRRSLQHELCAVMVPSTSRYGAAWVLDASYLGAVCVLLGCCESAEPPRRQHPTALKALTPASRKSR